MITDDTMGIDGNVQLSVPLFSSAFVEFLSTQIGLLVSMNLTLLILERFWVALKVYLRGHIMSCGFPRKQYTEKL